MRYTSALVALLALGGCLNYTTYYKEGVPAKAPQSAKIQCEVTAQHQVPPRIVHDWEPVYGYWDAHKKRYRISHYELVVVDLNEGLRAKVARQCMTDQGYDRVQIPYCDKDQFAGRTYSPLTKLPRFSSSLCAIRQKGRAPHIIDLAKPLPQ